MRTIETLNKLQATSDDRGQCCRLGCPIQSITLSGSIIYYFLIIFLLCDAFFGVISSKLV